MSALKIFDTRTLIPLWHLCVHKFLFMKNSKREEIIICPAIHSQSRGYVYDACSTPHSATGVDH